MIKPDTYNLPTVRDDIALVELSSSMTFFSKIKPIRIESANFTDLDRKVMQVSGFGRTTLAVSAQILQFTDVIGISTRECQAYYGPIITDKFQCTRGFSSPNSGTCYGDT